MVKMAEPFTADEGVNNEKGSKVIKIKYEEDSIFVGCSLGDEKEQDGDEKEPGLTLEAISDYLKKGAGVHSEEAYLD